MGVWVKFFRFAGILFMGWKVASKKFLKSVPEPSVSHYAIGLAFVIILKFHYFKSFFLPLFTWSYLPKNWSFLLSISFLKLQLVYVILFPPFLMGLFTEGVCALYWLLLPLREWLLFSFFFLCWLCLFLPFQSFSKFQLSWDFFSFLKLCAELWKPEEVLFTSPLLYESFWLVFTHLSCSFSLII